MTSCHDVTKPASSISACRFARKMILFMFSWFFWLLILKMLSFMYLWDDIVFITSRHDIALIHNITTLHLSYLVVGPNFDSFSNSMVIRVVSIERIIDTILQAAASMPERRVMTS